MFPLPLSAACITLLAQPPVPEPNPVEPNLLKQSLAAVSAARLMADVEALAGFGTRHTLSDTASPTRGIGAARNWIRGEIAKAGEKSGGRMTAELEEFDAPPSQRLPKGAHLTNVFGVLRGVDERAAARRIYIVGHYDSRNGDAMDFAGDAPGANDDASGTACVIEAARVLAEMPLRATVVFLATAGEEQGLIGAQYHASQAASRGDAILGVLSNDIVGDPAREIGGNASIVRVFSEALPRNPSAERLAAVRAASAESDSPSRQLARYVEETGASLNLAVKGKLIFRPDRFLRSGDHSAFNDAGFTAVRLTAGAEVYERQHVNVTQKDGKPYGDVPEFVDAEYLAGVARLNIATIVRLAMAPPPPANARIVTANLGNQTTIRWSANHDALTGGYQLVWRETTSPTWTHAKDLGLVSEIVVDTSKDDHFFGLRAVGKDGYASVVVFAMPRKE